MEDWKGGSRGRWLYIHIADSCRTAENNTMLLSNYTPIENNKINKIKGDRYLSM